MNSIIFYEQYVLFYYNTIPLQEQVFFFIYKNLFGIYEHLCSNLQFISLPEEVGEFLLYIMLKEKDGTSWVPCFQEFPVQQPLYQYVSLIFS